MTVYYSFGSTNAVQNTINADSSGDLVYAQNKTSSELQKDDKVLIRFSNVENTINTDLINPGNFTGLMIPMNSDYVNFSRPYSGNSFLYKYDYNNNTFRHIKTISGCEENKTNNPHLINFINDYQITYMPVNTSKYKILNLLTGENYDYTEFPIKDKIYFNMQTGKLLDKSNGKTFTTGWGDVRSNNYKYLFNENYITVSRRNGISILNITEDITQSTITVYNFDTTYGYNFGYTGLSIGDFCIVNTSSFIKFLKFDGTNWNEDFIFQVEYPGTCIYNYYAKIFTYLDPINHDLCAYEFNMETKQFIKLDIPIDIQNHYHNFRNSLSKYKYTSFLINKYKDIFTYTLVSDTYYSRSCAFKVNKSSENPIIIVDNITQNYNDNQSFTGFITGNINNNNKYEVSTKLPDKINITLNITPDPDNIIVYGEVK